MSERYQKPKTIDELRWFCDDHDIPARQMRFFIGEDFKEPKAFGIYQDADGEFVVYKNKADGSRAVRYKGPDEAFAVNEIYEKMKAETEQRRAAKRSSADSAGPGPSPYSSLSHSNTRSTNSGNRESYFTRGEKTALAIILTVAIAGTGIIGYKIVQAFRHTPNRGYYAFQGHKYYDDYGTWYYYDESYDDWYPADYVDPLLLDNYEYYYIGPDYYDEYFDEYGITDFEDSYYGDSYFDSGSSYYDDDDDYDWDWDWDDDDDWDWDDWDYDDSDWDSDW